jgi:hypothetical protein
MIPTHKKMRFVGGMSVPSMRISSRPGGHSDRNSFLSLKINLNVLCYFTEAQHPLLMTEASYFVICCGYCPNLKDVSLGDIIILGYRRI